MAVPNRKETPIDQALKLIDKLSPHEIALLRQKLDAKAWARDWNLLVKDIEQDNKETLPLSEEDIMEEVLIVRAEMKAERDIKGSP